MKQMDGQTTTKADELPRDSILEEREQESPPVE